MTPIKARAIADATTELAPEERIRRLASTVRRPASFAAAQRTHADLSQRHTELRAEQRRLIAQMLAEGGETANGSGPLIRRIKEVDTELTSCAELLRGSLARLVEAREPFAAAIAAALAPERTREARRALAAVMAAADHLAVLDAIDREIAAVGGQPGQHPMLGYRAGFEQLLSLAPIGGLMITPEMLARICKICVELGGLRFDPAISAKICDRLVEVICTRDSAGQAALANDLQQILADEAAAQEQRARGAIH